MNPSLLVKIVPALSDNYIYLLHSPANRRTVVIDPSEAEPVLAVLRAHRWTLDAIWNTHHHGDHTGGNLRLKEVTGCPIYAASSDAHRIPGIDHGLGDGESFVWEGHEVRLLSTPGHTLGAICYWLPSEQMVFTGDTLFSLGCGRLFEGEPEMMWQSMQKLRDLPPETRIYCGHEYTLANAAFALSLEPQHAKLLKFRAHIEKLRAAGEPSLPSTLADELACNPFLRADDPALQKAVGLKQAESWQFFAEIRRLKDNFK